MNDVKTTIFPVAQWCPLFSFLFGKGSPLKSTSKKRTAFFWKSTGHLSAGRPASSHSPGVRHHVGARDLGVPAAPAGTAGSHAAVLDPSAVVWASFFFLFFSAKQFETTKGNQSGNQQKPAGKRLKLWSPAILPCLGTSWLLHDDVVF